ncbi:protein CTLA-2-beta-like [Mesocricetus auratus]|uniref:Protein CTLA-2-beta-like n=1 Tax=Mesocricetus auratus TaxID=10036 RepID=A0ABM2YEE7_MESAU|nr:protein CTLA-2-beta-like [Mesocricetus auratus]XP_040612163.1 protein CTLA-2-beta-like [Mesocricetus auratus]
MASVAPSRDPSLDAEWEEWKRKFEKTYSQDEEGHRRALWEASKKEIDKHNVEYEQGKVSYSMSLNQFSDMTHEEFKSKCCGFPGNTGESPKSENLKVNS